MCWERRLDHIESGSESWWSQVSISIRESEHEPGEHSTRQAPSRPTSTDHYQLWVLTQHACTVDSLWEEPNKLFPDPRGKLILSQPKWLDQLEWTMIHGSEILRRVATIDYWGTDSSPPVFGFEPLGWPLSLKIQLLEWMRSANLNWSSMYPSRSIKAWSVRTQPGSLQGSILAQAGNNRAV